MYVISFPIRSSEGRQADDVHSTHQHSPHTDLDQLSLPKKTYEALSSRTSSIDVFTLSLVVLLSAILDRHHEPVSGKNLALVVPLNVRTQLIKDIDIFISSFPIITKFSDVKRTKAARSKGCMIEREAEFDALLQKNLEGLKILVRVLEGQSNHTATCFADPEVEGECDGATLMACPVSSFLCLRILSSSGASHLI